MKCERNEYPRPYLRRNDWQKLNGEWEFAFDDENQGIKKGYQNGKKDLDLKINVPFTFEYPASGINLNEIHEIVWYKRHFTIDKNNAKKRALLCCNGIDYEADIWINGVHATKHYGGFAPFVADVTDLVKANEADNVIVIRCYDPLEPANPRGKQSWRGANFGCWYRPNTGIWQSIWLDFFGEDCVSEFCITPDLDHQIAKVNMKTLRGVATEVELVVTYKEQFYKKVKVSLDDGYTTFDFKLEELDYGRNYTWCLNHPNLFYVEVNLYAKDKLVDTVYTRFGMRKISVDDNGVICLNNAPVYQKLILDQGYWEESGLTAPSAEAIKDDIVKAQQMGFNGARKHQKFEDPYFYWYAEELGFLTWCEMPSAYDYSIGEVRNVTTEWLDIVRVARAFTSVICYVPLNESWGTRRILTNVEEQNFARSLYYITKACDPSRLVSTNDGWEMVEATDLVGIHDYNQDGSVFPKRYFIENYSTMYPTRSRRLFAEGSEYEGQPVILTEYGGIAMTKELTEGNWGYGEGANSEEVFYKRFEGLMDGIYATSDFQGFCYTQLTDVQQEVNGLLNQKHEFKFDPAMICTILNKKKGDK